MPSSTSAPSKKVARRDPASDVPAAAAPSGAEAFRAQHEIEVRGVDESGVGAYSCPAPFLRFDAGPFDPLILKAIKRAGFDAPTSG